MTKDQFLTAFMNELRELNEEDKEQILEYYEELILDGQEMGRREEEIIQEFGDPREAAARIRREYAEYGEFLSALPAPAGKKEYHQQKNQKIHTVMVDAQNIPVEIVQVPEGQVQVVFSPRKDIDQVSWETKDGTYQFQHKMKPFSFNLFHWFQGVNRIYVELPDDFHGNLYVKTNNAPLNIKGIQSGLNNAKLTTNNARIQIEDFRCKSACVKTSNGSLSFLNTIGKELEASTSNGRISMEQGCWENGMILTTKNGPIYVNAIESPKIVLKTSNASITGRIQGDPRDYRIQSHTSNASSNLGNWQGISGQTKDLVAKTSNGKIHIDFIGNP